MSGEKRFPFNFGAVGQLEMGFSERNIRFRILKKKTKELKGDAASISVRTSVTSINWYTITIPTSHEIVLLSQTA